MAKKRLKKGIFITFEGVEGCGKSTHAKKVFKFLRKKYPCVFTREPGGTKIGEQIREILLNPRNRGISEETELLLFEANRAQVARDVILPALRKNKIVISDRFYDATTVYQGYASSMDIGFVKRLNAFSSLNLKPDLTIVLDIDVKIGLKRALRVGRKDRMEQKKILYHKRVRAGYRRIAKLEPGRVKLITVKERIEDTQRLIRREAEHVIKKFEAPTRY